VLKLILNIILISNPNINIYGATISSIVCQGVAFAICWAALNKYIKMNISFKRNILKPVISALIMGMVAYGTYLLMYNLMWHVHIAAHADFWINTISTITAIFIGAVVYVFAVLFTKCLTKEELHMIPYGSRIYGILAKVRLYD